MTSDLGLNEEEMEEAQATKFARLLIKELRQRRHDSIRDLIASATGGSPRAGVYAGRVTAYEDALRLIGVAE